MEHNMFHHRRRMNRNDHKRWTNHDYHHHPPPSASPSTQLPTTSMTPSTLLHQRGLTDDEIRSIFELLYYTQHENDSSNLDTTATTSTTRIDPAVNHRKVVVTSTSTHRRSSKNSVKNRSTSIPFFSIVPCGTHCEKLSLPPYAFTNGLYVLQRPTPGTTTTTYGTYKHGGHKHRKVTTATTTTTVENNNTNTWNETQRPPHDSTGKKNVIQKPPITIPAHLQQYPIWRCCFGASFAAAIAIALTILVLRCGG